MALSVKGYLYLCDRLEHVLGNQRDVLAIPCCSARKKDFSKYTKRKTALRCLKKKGRQKTACCATLWLLFLFNLAIFIDSIIFWFGATFGNGGGCFLLLGGCFCNWVILGSVQGVTSSTCFLLFFDFLVFLWTTPVVLRTYS